MNTTSFSFQVGAVAAAKQRINIIDPGKLVETKQAMAAIGQPLLMRIYHEIFSDFGIRTAQCLMTYRDFENETSRTNTLNTINELLKTFLHSDHQRKRHNRRRRTNFRRQRQTLRTRRRTDQSRSARHRQRHRRRFRQKSASSRGRKIDSQKSTISKKPKAWSKNAIQNSEPAE